MDADRRLLGLLAEGVQADILQWLLRDGELTQSQLADRTGLAPPLLSRRLVELENFGLIGRTPSKRTFVALHPAKTSDLLRLAAELASDVLSRQATEAVERSRQLRDLGQLSVGNEESDLW